MAETRGNPTALLELPEGLSPAQLAGGFGLPLAASPTGRVGHAFDRRLAALPAETRRLVVLAAADPSGDRALVWRAARLLGIAAAAGARRRRRTWSSSAPGSGSGTRWPARRPTSPPPCGSGGRRTRPWRRRPTRSPTRIAGRGIGPRPRPPPTRRSRSSWSRSAGRAQARGGLAAAAAFLERSVALTADPARQAAPRAGRGAGQPAGRRLRQRPRPAHGGGGGAARRVRQRPGGPAARPGGRSPPATPAMRPPRC